jgi:hypothetical protein
MDFQLQTTTIAIYSIAKWYKKLSTLTVPITLENPQQSPSQ